MASSADESKQIEETVASFLAERPEEIAAGWLFGSFARGTARADSDVDLALLLSREPEPTLEGSGSELEGDLERLLRRPVQVVLMNGAPVDLVHRVLRDGHLVLERDRSARVRFEVRARNEYFDLLPILNEYRRARTAAPEGGS